MVIEKILYPTMALTMIEDWLVLDSQQATAIENKAAPASLPIRIEDGSVSEVPNKTDTSTEGAKANARPVTPSIKLVIVSKDFI